MGKRSDLAGQLQESVQDEMKDTEDRFQKMDQLVGSAEAPAGGKNPKPSSGQKKTRAVNVPEPQASAPDALVDQPTAPIANAENHRKRTMRRNSLQTGFTLPPESLQLIETVQTRAIRARGKNTTRSDVIRVALNVLSELKPADLKKAFDNLPPVPRGRPQGDE